MARTHRKAAGFFALSNEPRVRMEARSAPYDRMTIAAIGTVAYALSNLLHEGVGHGGACLLAGGRPRLLTSLHFDGDPAGLSDQTLRFISAGGTLANLLAAALALLILRGGRCLAPHTRYFLWLLASVNLLQATGYLLFSGVSGIGDWAAATEGWRPAWLWRIGLTLIGGATYAGTVRGMLMGLGPFLGPAPAQRVGRAVELTVIPYVVGGLLYCLSGLFNPQGLLLVLISGAAASLGGTSGLAWGAQLLHGDHIPPSAEGPLPLARHEAWIALAALFAALFLGVLGPGIRLS